MTSWHPCSLPELPTHSSRGESHPVLSWVPAKSPCSARLVSFHQLILWHTGTAFSCAFRISQLKNVQSSWLLYQDCLPRASVNQAPNVCLKKFKVAVLLTYPFLLSWNQKLYHFMIPVPKMPPTITSPTSPSLFTNKSGEVYSLAGWLGK